MSRRGDHGVDRGERLAGRRPDDEAVAAADPRAFWQWAKWRRERMNYRSEAAWRRAQPKSVRGWIAKEGGKVPDWAWVRLAAMAPKP